MVAEHTVQSSSSGAREALSSSTPSGSAAVTSGASFGKLSKPVRLSPPCVQEYEQGYEHHAGAPTYRNIASSDLMRRHELRSVDKSSGYPSSSAESDSSMAYASCFCSAESTDVSLPSGCSESPHHLAEPLLAALGASVDLGENEEDNSFQSSRSSWWSSRCCLRCVGIGSGSKALQEQYCGLYMMARSLTAQELISTDGLTVGRSLDIGQVVDVVEARIAEDGKVVGRITEPVAGWITLIGRKGERLALPVAQ